MTTIEWSARVTATLVCAFAATACGDSEAGSCRRSDECRSGLCVASSCAPSCESDADCPENRYCSEVVPGAGRHCVAECGRFGRPTGSDTISGILEPVACVDGRVTGCEVAPDSACYACGGCAEGTTFCSYEGCIPLLEEGETCVGDYQCASGLCTLDGVCEAPRPVGDPCTHPEQCESDSCSSTDRISEGRCMLAMNTPCVEGEANCDCEVVDEAGNGFCRRPCGDGASCPYPNLCFHISSDVGPTVCRRSCTNLLNPDPTVCLDGFECFDRSVSPDVSTDDQYRWVCFPER